MTINWQIWKKPETGGVLISLSCLVALCLFLFIRTLVHFEITQIEMANTSIKTKLLSNQIKAVEDYEKLQQQESQKFNIFKKKKWNQPLTHESLNQTLYSLQKQSNVEFLFIQPKAGTNKLALDQNNIQKTAITLLIKVLRDQSFFSFLQKLESELPGVVRIKHFELKRVRELNSQLAQKVSQGEKISLFEGRIELEIEYAQFN